MYADKHPMQPCSLTSIELRHDMDTICILCFFLPHLEAVPGVGTLTAGSLAGGDAQSLGGHADGALHLQLLVLSTLDQVSAHCKKRMSVYIGYSVELEA